MSSPEKKKKKQQKQKQWRLKSASPPAKVRVTLLAGALVYKGSEETQKTKRETKKEKKEKDTNLGFVGSMSHSLPYRASKFIGTTYLHLLKLKKTTTTT